MLGVTDFPAYVLAVLVFLMLPGPGTFAILGATAAGGVRSGYAALAGVVLGDWLLMLAAMAGVAALLHAHPLLFRAVQWLGVGYLVWIGVQLLWRGVASPRSPMPHARQALRRAFLITLLNPKAIVFYMAFFPLFIDPARYQGVATLAVLGATASALTLAYCSLLIVAGHWAAARLRAHRLAVRVLARLAGVAMIGFGARLATD